MWSRLATGGSVPPHGTLVETTAIDMGLERWIRAGAMCLLVLVLVATPSRAQTEADPAIVAEIAKIKAIDNHAHPVRAVAEGEEDREFDALIPDKLEPAPLPPRLRPDNPEYVAAWRALYGYRHDDMREAHVRDVLDAKQRTRREQGDGYPRGSSTGSASRRCSGTASRWDAVSPRRAFAGSRTSMRCCCRSTPPRRASPGLAAFFRRRNELLSRYLSDLGRRLFRRRSASISRRS